jgi:hypothetical protein
LDQRPKLLYKYQPVTARSLENLKLKELWFSAPAAFNDPFDCALDVRFKQIDDDDVARALEYARGKVGLSPEFEAEIVSAKGSAARLREAVERSAVLAFGRPEIEAAFKQVGVACFAEKYDDLLMWAHYADGHRGFCLEFSTDADPFGKAFPVAYTDKTPEVNPLDLLDKRPTGADIMDVMLGTKHTCWQYEREWRITHAQAGTSYTYPYRALTGLYFGASMSSGQKDVVGQLLLGEPVQLYEMQRAEGGFAVAPRPVVYTPYHGQSGH